jgi:hypothetical protein
VDQRATADENGVFVLTATSPQNPRVFPLRVTGAGYEAAQVLVDPTSPSELRLLRTLTIGRGESIQMRVFLGSNVCGDESHLCRRVVLESSAREPMNLEVIPADSPAGCRAVCRTRGQTPVLGYELSPPGDGVGRRGLDLPGGSGTYWRSLWESWRI